MSEEIEPRTNQKVLKALENGELLEKVKSIVISNAFWR